MLSTFSSNVILSKARAMYGQRLVWKDYQTLLGCHSVNEIAAYLKQTPRYREILVGINERECHRGQLEMLLKKKLFFDFASLCRYELSSGEHFAEYLISRSEIEQLLHSLMLMTAGKSSEYLFSLPSFLEQHTHVNLRALAQMKNYDDFLVAVEHTPYYKLLQPLSPPFGKQPDLTAIENTLYTYLYQKVYGIIKKHVHGEAKKELKGLFDSYIDLNNYVRIFRLKKFYKASPDQIRSLLFPFGSINPRYLNEMILAKDPSDVISVMMGTSRGKQLSSMEYTFIDELPVRVKYKQCRHFIRFSTHPSVVMLAYIFLTEIELANITNVIEGIRYQISTEETKKLLVYNKKATA